MGRTTKIKSKTHEFYCVFNISKSKVKQLYKSIRTNMIYIWDCISFWSSVKLCMVKNKSVHFLFLIKQLRLGSLYSLTVNSKCTNKPHYILCAIWYSICWRYHHRFTSVVIWCLCGDCDHMQTSKCDEKKLNHKDYLKVSFISIVQYFFPPAPIPSWALASLSGVSYTGLSNDFGYSRSDPQSASVVFSAFLLRQKTAIKLYYLCAKQWICWSLRRWQTAHALITWLRK